MQDTWWSLQAIESIISSVTGRPSINLSENCTVAAPRAGSTSKLQHALNDKRIPQLQDQSADLPAHPSNARRAGRTHYFAAHIRITMITQRVLSNLYSPRTASQTWEVSPNCVEPLKRLAANLLNLYSVLLFFVLHLWNHVKERLCPSIVCVANTISSISRPRLRFYSTSLSSGQ